MMRYIQVMVALVALNFSQSAMADMANGQRLYGVHCASCHGINGRPVMPNTPNFQMREGLDKPDFDLIQIVLTGMSPRTGKNHLPPFMGILKETEVADIIQYVRIIR